ncbi:MAG TPA: glycosyltransferase family 2 protein [Candidatus Rubrimentiphilum sp.]|nr:glycosyltransferase family 2 protein [Candidatus Rubrimentiphilum sp.]
MPRFAGNPPSVTIVTGVFNEEASLEAFRAEVLRSLLSRTDVHYEVLFVDDGSTDRSWEIIERFCEESPRFRGLRLSRNFGAHTADAAGIDRADGDAVVTLACDLQDPPETILEFVDKWRAGAQIVWGRRRSRAENKVRVLLVNLFSWLMRVQAMPKGSKFSTGGFFLIDRRVVECFRQFREHNRITFALVAWTGFKQDVVLYDRRARKAGSSGWNFSRMIKAMYDALLGFSSLLPRLITLLGAAIFLVNIPVAIFLIVNYFLSRPLPGWTGVMISLSFFFGVVCLMLGGMSEYLHMIYIETTGRPLYFVAQEAGTTRPEER